MENNDYTELANKLLNLRKKAGFTQNHAADRLGVSRQTISKWETGKSIPDSIMIKRVCSCYEITPDEFFELLLAKEDQQSAIIGEAQEHTKKNYRLVIILLVVDFILSLMLVAYSANMVFWVIYANVLFIIAYIVGKVVHYIKTFLKSRDRK